jgi:hypothetical protein
LVIQYFWLSVVGLWMSKVLVRGCQVAVVCISTALLPAQSSDSMQQDVFSTHGMAGCGETCPGP